MFEPTTLTQINNTIVYDFHHHHLECKFCSNITHKTLSICCVLQYIVKLLSLPSLSVDCIDVCRREWEGWEGGSLLTR